MDGSAKSMLTVKYVPGDPGIGTAKGTGERGDPGGLLTTRKLEVIRVQDELPNSLQYLGR